MYADPPWNYGNSGLDDYGHAERHYPTMSIEELGQLGVPDIVEENSVLFIWTTSPLLEDCFRVIRMWGFNYKTIAFGWVKKYKSGSLVYNFAPYTLKSCEICILGIKGKMGKYKKANNVKQLVEAVRTKHSKKPDEVRKRIEALYGNLPRIELFAREKVEGWDSWGLEV